MRNYNRLPPTCIFIVGIFMKASYKSRFYRLRWGRRCVCATFLGCPPAPSGPSSLLIRAFRHRSGHRLPLPGWRAWRGCKDSLLPSDQVPHRRSSCRLEAVVCCWSCRPCFFLCFVHLLPCCSRNPGTSPNAVGCSQPLGLVWTFSIQTWKLCHWFVFALFAGRWSFW